MHDINEKSTISFLKCGLPPKSNKILLRFLNSSLMQVKSTFFL